MGSSGSLEGPGVDQLKIDAILSEGDFIKNVK
jgi:hypothetical protein